MKKQRDWISLSTSARVAKSRVGRFCCPFQRRNVVIDCNTVTHVHYRSVWRKWTITQWAYYYLLLILKKQTWMNSNSAFPVCFLKLLDSLPHNYASKVWFLAYFWKFKLKTLFFYMSVMVWNSQLGTKGFNGDFLQFPW